MKPIEFNNNSKLPKEELIPFGERQKSDERPWDSIDGELCHCGKPVDLRFDPCCSLVCWHKQFIGESE